MRILLVTAAPPGSEFGSETTAIRWEHILEDLGHEVETTYTYGKFQETHADESFEAMIAIGAVECDDAITTFLAADEERPVILALNSADLYDGIDNDPTVLENVERASELIGFHDRAPQRVPHRFRDKMRVIRHGVELPEGGLEGISPPPHREEKQARPYRFEVCVANNLQEGDDPLRTAKAAARLGEESKVRVVHVGRVLDSRWETQVRRESQNNDRYEWFGEVPWERALRIIRHADLLAATPSRGGGSNVLAESIVLETPVLASHVPGNIGLLGERYPGLFKPKDDRDLAELLGAAEKGSRFYNELQASCRELESSFDVEHERRAWSNILAHYGSRTQHRQRPGR